MSVLTRLKELGLELPPAPSSVAAYLPAVEAGGFVFTAGQLPMRDGQVIYRGVAGRELDLEQAYLATRLAALNGLAAVAALGVDLDRIGRVVRVTGYLRAAPAFDQIPQAMNGASELLLHLFGERGRHARSAVGVAALPLDAVCEVELMLQIDRNTGP